MVLEQSSEYNGEPSLPYHGLKHQAQATGLVLVGHFAEIPMRIPTRVTGGALIVTLLTQLTACGTLFYPDRRGQIEGKIDPVIAALDAVGLLFYVIPGLIAFGVDFASGAIYYPPGVTAHIDPVKLKPAINADGQVDKTKLQAILESELGQRLPLNDPRLIQHRGSVEQLAAYGLVPAA